MGLKEIVFQYEDLILHVGAVAHIPHDWPVGMYLVPITIEFSSEPGKQFKTGVTYDSNRALFIDSLIEDEQMQRNFPEKFNKIQDKDEWHKELELYRLEASKLYSLCFHTRNIPIQKIGKKEVKGMRLKLIHRN